VSKGKEIIIDKQDNIPRIGIKGTRGVLKALGASGWVFLMIITPAQTRIKANKVPILVISPTTCPGTKAANSPTNKQKIKLEIL
jgi:hypothetical protein